MRPSRAELAAVLRLALPIVLVQVGMLTMGTVDTIMVGRISAAALAAVALGNLYHVAATAFAMGLLLALDPVVAQAIGAGDTEAAARGLQRGLVLAAVAAMLSSLLLLPGEPVLALLDQPAEVVPTAAEYALITIGGTLPFFGFVALRQCLQALGRVRPIVVTIALANVANALLNWMLIYGKLGAPALGPLGSAWATVASRWFMCLGLLRIAWPALRPFLVPLRPDALLGRPLARMVVLGAPLGLQLLAEISAFGAIALFMGWFGTVAMAAHQVAINLASLTFNVPLGVASAAAVLVGRAVGRGDGGAARHAAASALLIGVAFMTFSGFVFLLLPEVLAGLYTNTPAVLALAASLIPIAGLFQVFDGVQVVSIGVLRGTGDTRTPMIVALLGFWFVGMPVSLLLGFPAGLGPQGLWWGFVAGLAAVATFLLLRVRSRLAGEIARLDLDAEPARTDAA